MAEAALGHIEALQAGEAGQALAHGHAAAILRTQLIVLQGPASPARAAPPAAAHPHPQFLSGYDSEG